MDDKGQALLSFILRTTSSMTGSCELETTVYGRNDKKLAEVNVGHTQNLGNCLNNLKPH